MLSFAALTAKICGVIFKIPLYAVIKDEGMGYFNSAYVIYTFFYVFTTSGLPVGLSLLVSDARTFEEKNAWRNRALFCFGIPGLAVCLLMMLFPGFFAGAIGNPGAEKSIFVMGPALLFVCLEGVFRGYFQGKKNMLPTAVSQIIESVFKAGLGILAATLAVRSGCGPDAAAAWALTGITVGGFFGLVYLLIRCLSDEKKERDFRCAALDRSVSARRLLSVVFPISLASVVLSISSVIDLSVIMHRLYAAGYSLKSANAAYGNYSGLALPFFTLPAAFAAPIASALVPHLKSVNRDRDRLAVHRMSEAAVRLTVIVSLPFTVGYGLLSGKILALFFDAGAAAQAAPLLTLLAPSVVFVSFTTVSASCLQASGHGVSPVVSLLCGAAAKVIICYFLIARIAINGAPVGTFVCSLVSAGMNAAFLYRYGLLRISVKKTLVFPLLSALLCALSVKAVTVLTAGLPSPLCVAIAIVCAAVVYAGGIAVSGCIDDCTVMLIPSLAKVSAYINKRKFCYDGKRKRTDQGSLRF